MPVKAVLLTSVAATLLFTVSILRADDNDINILSTPITDKLHMLTGKGGNIGLFIGEDGTFVIDDQFAPLSDRILAKIVSLGGDIPRFLVNTHFHGDHTGGNESFGKLGALIMSHDNVRERLVNGSFIKAYNWQTPPAQKAALPLLTFSEDMHLHINNESVNVIHIANAHTDGDSIVHFKKANVVHTGDIFFNGFYPFIDTANGGSLKGVINAVDTILALTDTQSKIIPGHGPLADRTQLQAYQDMLNIAYTRLLKLKNAGVSAEDAVLRTPLEDLEAQWGDGFFAGEQWINVIYPSVD